MKYTLLFIFIFASFAHAESIYRSVDEQGNVLFSDEPQTDSQQIELSPTTVYTPEQTEAESGQVTVEKVQPVEEAAVYELRIVSPSNNESIWVNDGNVMVNVSVEPALQPDHRLSVDIDGETVLAEPGSVSVRFTNLFRGSHTATASVLDADGQLISSSEPVQFHLHRASVAN